MAKRNHPKTPMQPPVIQNLVRPFLAFTTTYSGRSNKLITPIEITSAFDPNVTPPDQLKKLEDSSFKTKALWDTGATNSVITELTAASMGLVSVGNAMVNHAGGTEIRNKFIINILLPNKVAIPGVMVNDISVNSDDFGMLIGMDIISQGDLSVSNHNNKTSMSFRLPSYQMTDYVVESDRLTYKNVPRNKPCICGNVDSSGRPILFKNCHGKNV